MNPTITRLGINLETTCTHPECAQFAYPLWKQLSDGPYDLCSVMDLPESVEDWRAEHRTARKRADRAERAGFRFTPVIHHERVDELYEINTSAVVRQGRPMSPGYRQRPSETPDSRYPCERHGVHRYGIETNEGRLVGYLWIYRAGELALVSQILGHVAYLGYGVMYLLWQEMLRRELEEPGCVVYNRHDSGTDGLRFYKDRVGLREHGVDWLL